jgi:hypothetical protein
MFPLEGMTPKRIENSKSEKDSNPYADKETAERIEPIINAYGLQEIPNVKLKTFAISIAQRNSS